MKLRTIDPWVLEIPKAICSLHKSTCFLFAEFRHQLSKRIGRKARKVRHDHRPRLPETEAATPGCDSVPGPHRVRSCTFRGAASASGRTEERPAPLAGDSGTGGGRAAPTRAPPPAGRATAGSVQGPPAGWASSFSALSAPSLLPLPRPSALTIPGAGSRGCSNLNACLAS